MAEFRDVVRLFRRLSDEEHRQLDRLSSFLSKDESKYAERLLKQRKISIDISEGDKVFEHEISIVVGDDVKDNSIRKGIDSLNRKLQSKSEDLQFREFSKSAAEELPKMIAPEIVGFELVKKAVAIQLFSEERIHILLLGDPGTGKTKILGAAAKLHPISSMGLGSGTSGAGLAVTVKGNEVIKGLLPMADRGLCAIDELNLMKDDSRASLYNAMESGFVSYSKGGKHYRFDARVSVLATANPKGDRFKGTQPEQLKKQLPFDPALLSRFHLTFLVRRPDVEEFKNISRNILSGRKERVTQKEIDFVKRYISYANRMNEPELPNRFEQEVVDFIGSVKSDEERYLIEVSPRMVVGFMRMAKALARSELRSKVNEQDISTVKAIIKDSLKIV